MFVLIPIRFSEPKKDHFRDVLSVAAEILAEFAMVVLMEPKYTITSCYYEFLGSHPPEL